MNSIDIYTIIFVILSIVSPISYTRKMLQGTTKPHRITRLVVWVASLTSLIAVIGSSNLSGKIFGIVFFARATYMLAMSLKYGVGGRSKLDVTCLVIGVAGVLASVTNNGLLGIWLALVADLIGYVPAFIKTYKNPKSEEPVFYTLESFAAISVIIGIGEIRKDIILPIYFVVSSLVMIGLIFRKKIMPKIIKV